MAQVNYAEILSFRKCPLLSTRFGYRETQEIEEPVVRILYDTIMNNYAVKVASGGRVSYTAGVTMMEEYVKSLLDKGVSRKKINNFTILVKKGIAALDAEVERLGYRIMFTDLMTMNDMFGVHYSEAIPLVFLCAGSIMPVYFNALPYPANPRSNYVRLTTAALREMFSREMPIREFGTINLQKNGASTLSIWQIEDIDTWAAEFKFMLKAIGEKGFTPNTIHCQDCPYLLECKL